MDNFAPNDESGVDEFCRSAMAMPALAPDEEVLLSRRVEEGDSEARDRLIRANLRLVVQAARRHAADGSMPLRLLQAGTDGLLFAVEAFDPTVGESFAECAVGWIDRAIQGAVSGDESAANA